MTEMEKQALKERRLANLKAGRERQAAQRAAAAAGPAPVSEVERLKAELAALKAQLSARDPAPPPAAKPKRSPNAMADAAEEEVKRQVAEVLGTRTPPPPPPRQNYVLDEDPARQANLMALQIMEEQKAMAARRARDRVADPRLALEDEINRGRSAIEIFIDAPEMPNPFAFEDDDGADLREPGYVYHWTRVKHTLNDLRDNRQRLRQRLAWGAEVVLKPSDGKELRTDTLVATRIPVKREAQRKIALADPGTFDNARALSNREVERLQQVADDENVAYSRRHTGGNKGVVHLQPAAGHGVHYGPADEGDE
jgi:hypothetical protein